jgi:carbonic anhydrase
VSELASLLAANAVVVATLGDGSLPAAPRRRLAILTCMDARVAPLRMLGLDLGDAHVIRNAGGRASDDAIRSLALARALLAVETALVIHHTDCRLRGVDEAALRAALSEAGAEVPAEAAFLPLPAAMADGVRADVARLREAALIPPGLTVHGLVYDVRTGLVTAVPE